MLKECVVSLLLAGAIWNPLKAERNLSYIELSCQTFEQMAAILDSLQASGLNVIHIFPPDALIAETGCLDLSKVLLKSAVRLALPSSSFSRQETPAPLNEMAFAVWQYLTNPENAKRGPSESKTPRMDCEDHRPEIPSDLADLSVHLSPAVSPTNMITGNFMLGRIALKIILMESNGPDENWGPVFENTAIAEIVQGLDWLSSEAEQRGQRVTWVYDVSLGVPTDFEPIQEHSVPYYSPIFPPLSWEFFWIDDAFDYLGYPSEWDGAFALANNMRHTYQANWGFSVFVVMDNNDEDHRFSDGKFAFVMPFWDWTGSNLTKWPGSLVTMTYNSGGLGPSWMDQVIRHEVGHIFRVPDEYYDEDRDKGCKDDDCENEYGYLWVVNGNCERCNPNWVSCVMKNNLPSICSYTLGHYGWRDTDGDGPADPIDPNSGGWMSIPNVQKGDLVRIFTIGADFVSLISVTNDNMIPGSPNAVIWDGHNYDDQVCVSGQEYLITINNGSPFERYLNVSHPSVSPVFTGISYSNGTVNWQLTTSWAYVRCFIYDSEQNLVARPIWDKLYVNNLPQSVDVDFLPYEQNYTARFYAWRPDGGKSSVVNYGFFHPCDWLIGDVNASGTINIADATYLIAYIFSGGPPPVPHLKAGDCNCNTLVNLADAVYIVQYVFAGGPPPGGYSPDCTCEDAY